MTGDFAGEVVGACVNGGMCGLLCGCVLMCLLDVSCEACPFVRPPASLALTCFLHATTVSKARKAKSALVRPNLQNPDDPLAALQRRIFAFINEYGGGGYDTFDLGGQEPLNVIMYNSTGDEYRYVFWSLSVACVSRRLSVWWVTSSRLMACDSLDTYNGW